MPSLHQLIVMLFYQMMNLIYSSSCKASAALQSDGNEQKFCHIIVPFNMDIFWFVPVTSVKEKTVMPSGRRGWFAP
jgi:hypothetical protein